MSAAHTPGPWRALDQVGKHPLIGVAPYGNGYEWSSNAGLLVAGCTGPDREANARLIAAAPELLEALRISLEFLKNTKPYKGQEDLLADAIAMNTEVIAKATGAQS